LAAEQWLAGGLAHLLPLRPIHTDSTGSEILHLVLGGRRAAEHVELDHPRDVLENSAREPEQPHDEQIRESRQTALPALNLSDGDYIAALVCEELCVRGEGAIVWIEALRFQISSTLLFTFSGDGLEFFADLGITANLVDDLVVSAAPVEIVQDGDEEDGAVHHSRGSHLLKLVLVETHAVGVVVLRVSKHIIVICFHRAIRQNLVSMIGFNEDWDMIRVRTAIWVILEGDLAECAAHIGHWCEILQTKNLNEGRQRGSEKTVT